MINHCYREFMKRATYIQQNVKTAEKFGGSKNFVTLSQVLTYNKLFTNSPPAGALIYGFSCIRAREAAVFFLYPDGNRKAFK